jgi:hypothetical protein
MTTQQKIIKNKLGLLKLAESLGSGARLATQGEEAIRQRDSRRTSAVGHPPDWAKALPIHSG